MAAGQSQSKHSSSTALTSKMDAQQKMINSAKFEELTLIDPELNTSYIIRVSETDAQRARNDMNFASSLLRYAQKLQKVADLNRKTKENQPPNTSSPLERDMIKNRAASTVSSQPRECSNKEVEPESSDCSIQTAQSTPPAESSQSDITTDTSNTDAMHVWSKKETLLLLTVYNENEDMFNNGKVSQKNCWNQVSKLLKQKGYDISGHKCATKFQALKRTYKKIKDHNGKSGNQRKDWEYFEKMNELFGTKPWVSPPATAGSDSNNFDKVPEQPKRAKLTPASEYLKDLLKHKQERARTRDAQHEQKLEALSKLHDVMYKILEKK